MTRNVILRGVFSLGTLAAALPYGSSSAFGADDPKVAAAQPERAAQNAPLSYDDRVALEAKNALANPATAAPTVVDSAGVSAMTNVRQGDVAVSLVEQKPTPRPANGTEPTPRAPILASRRLSYQAVLTDNAGNALPGPNVNLSFRIYDTLVAGALVEGPINVLAVAINNGVVNAQIPVSSSTFDGADRYMSVSVNGGAELSPRIQLTTVAYALRVDRVASEELDDSIVLGRANAPQAPGAMSLQNGLMTQPSIELVGSAHRISTYGSDGLEQIRLWGEIWGELWLNDEVGNNMAVYLSAQSNSGGLMQLRDGDGATRAQLQGQSTGTGGELSLYDDDGTETVEIIGAASAAEGANVYLRNAAGTNTIQLDADSGSAALIGLRNTAGASRITLDGDSSGAGFVTVYQNDGSTGITLDGDAGTNIGGLVTVNDSVSSPRVTLTGESIGTGGEVSVGDDNGTETVELLGAEDANTGGQLTLRRADGTSTITLDAEFGVAGSDAQINITGRTVTSILQITGGADLSEDFDVSGEPQPGMVVCIDEANPGKLVVSRSAYDKKVAGIVSGANGVRTGMLMGQKKQAGENEASIADGQLPIALTGRVYCYVDATESAIQPGDMLTTSHIPGYAMKVVDHERAHGATIGKAMTSLKKGERGFVLVLVNCQ